MNRIALVGIFLGWSVAASAQEALQLWIKQHGPAAATALAAKKKPSQNQSISIDHGSTTLVDQSSGTDLVHTAFNLVPLGGPREGSGTVTASLYSLYALATRQEPLRPTVYNAHSGLRKYFFTAGREAQDSTSGNTARPGTVVGGRWLPWNTRDASSIMNDKYLSQELAQIATDIAGANARVTSQVLTLLFQRFAEGASLSEFGGTLSSADAVQALVNRLSPAERAQLDGFVSSYFERSAVASKALKALIDGLGRRFQFAIDFQTVQRPDAAADDYKAQLVLDKALAPNLFFTLNGSFEYADSKRIGADVRSGRGAIELRYNITQVALASLRLPMQLALSGEGLRKLEAWQYRAQLQLSIPLTTGITLPVSFGYGNRSEILRQQEKDVYGKFGLSLDVGKIVDGLRGQ